MTDYSDSTFKHTNMLMSEGEQLSSQYSILNFRTLQAECDRLKADNDRLRGCEDVLRLLASLVGAGGYNAPTVDPDVFARKILDGINILNDPLAQLVIKKGEQIDQLKAENEALRNDAERYRFIRDADRSDGILDVHDLGLYAMESLDGVIDEAMERSEEGSE